jgi:hypothetical protein
LPGRRLFVVAAKVLKNGGTLDAANDMLAPYRHFAELNSAVNNGGLFLTRRWVRRSRFLTRIFILFGILCLKINATSFVISRRPAIDVGPSFRCAT